MIGRIYSMYNYRTSSYYTASIFAVLITFIAPCSAGEIYRIKPSTPKNLLDQIYNNALIGNDRLADVENYMSSGLKSAYKKAIKFKKSGGKCELPRILSNGIFSGKLKGFNVEIGEQTNWSASAKVILDTGSRNLSPTSELVKFDPKIYEVVNFYFTKRFIEWKIDDIKVSTPNLGQMKNGPSYQEIDLKEFLNSCK